MLRISDVIELAMVSRKTIYNAINSGRLKYQLVNVDNRQVRMFLEEDVFEAFQKPAAAPRKSRRCRRYGRRWLPQVCPRGTAKGGQRHGS